MTPARAGAIAVVAIALALPAAAHAETTQVDMFNSAFSPARVTVVAGDEVTWRNGDITVHDVRGPGFSSGIIGRFMGYTQRFDTPGPQAYVCGLHLGMAGQVDVLAATLTPPAGEAIEGEQVQLKGRTAPGTPSVTIERGGPGGTWQPAGDVKPQADGTFKATVGAATAYRARTAAGESPAVTQTVLAAPAVKLSVSKSRLKVTTTPARKGLLARFEVRKPSGWRRFAAKKLDSAGRATVPASKLEGRVRVVLTRDARGAALATSKAVRL